MSAPTHRYEGSCHCTAIGFDFRTAIEPGAWSVRACQCSFCRAHDALSTSDPDGELRWKATRPEFLQRYRFALKTADFLLCRNCGVYIGADIESGRGRFGIINVRALAPVPQDIADAAPARYDGEQTSGRISRRETRWTPVIASGGR